MRQTGILIILILLFCTVSGANAFQDIDVVSAAGPQRWAVMAPDYAGGYYIAWQDERDGNWDVYAQRISSQGKIMWQQDGIPVCTTIENQSGLSGSGDAVRATSDSAGLVIVWRDERGGEAAADIYAQRIRSDGQIMWAVNGIVICAASNEQAWPVALADGLGNATFVWEDFRNGADIYGQRVDAQGNLLWPADGIPICNARDSQRGPFLEPDGVGGMFIVWIDLRNGFPPQYDIYAQRINSAGQSLWATNGVAVCRARDDQYVGAIAHDGEGGLIITWHDERRVGVQEPDIYAQKLLADGTAAWARDGIAVAAGGGIKQLPRMAPAHDGGAYIAWSDFRDGLTRPDLFIQRVLPDGKSGWQDNGLPLSVAAINKHQPYLSADSGSGVWVSWTDFRSGNISDIYVQHFGSDGMRRYSGDGQAVASSPLAQSQATLLRLASGDLAVAWQTDRTATGHDLSTTIFGKQVSTVKSYYAARPEMGSVSIFPNPGRAQRSVRFNALPGERCELRVLDITGRLLFTKFVLASSSGVLVHDISLDQIPAGIYFVSVEGKLGSRGVGSLVRY